MTSTRNTDPAAPGGAADPADDAGDIIDFDAIVAPTPPAPRADTNLVRDLAGWAFADATTPAQRRAIFADPAIAVVVQVPSVTWVQPTYRALRTAAQWRKGYFTDGTTTAARQAAGAGPEAAAVIAEGGRVLGISHAPDRDLPAPLVAAADHRVVVRGLSNRSLRRAIRTVAGTPPRLDPDLGAGLDILDVAAALRTGTTPASCVARLRALRDRASTGNADLAAVPHLRDLHGYGVAKNWAIDLCRDVDAFRRGDLPWSRVQGNAVLSGPPGCGKTTLVRSLAKSAGLPFFPSSVGAWFSTTGGYLNEVVKAIDALFAKAAAASPSLVFLDELDALPNRVTLDARHADYWRVVVNHLLAVLDGATSAASASKVVVVGATNYAELLDPALVRPGRLERIVEIPAPGADDLARIFRQHLGDDLPGFDPLPLARLVPGATGAQVVGWIGRARASARRDDRPLRVADLAVAVAPPDGRSQEHLRRLAVHEAGHAVLAIALGVGDVASVSLVRNAHTDAHTAARLVETGGIRRGEAEKFVASLLAGRAAEEVILGDVTAGAGGGAGSDLAMATRTVVSLHAHLGLGDSLVYLASPEHADALLIDREFRDVVAADLDRIYADALEAVRVNEGAVMAVAERLLADRVVDGATVTRIVREHIDGGRGIRKGREASHG